MSAITPENVAVEELAPAAELIETDDLIETVDTDLAELDEDSELDAEDAELDDDSDDSAGSDDPDDSAGSEASEAVSFGELGLPEELVKKLAENGVHGTFPIQAATIPDALAGRHVLGKARTGSGKTLAFGLAALANLKGKRARKGKPLALVLVPTRELAMQVSDALQPYGFAVGADIAAVYGGAPMYKQVFALRRGVEVLVATPGRLTDLIEQEECDLSEVAIAILDEADQMADMGFMPIVSELLSQTDPAGQRLLFSATLDGAVDELVRQYMTDPVLHSVTPDSDDQAQMDHHLLIVEPADKALVTAEIAARHTPGGDDGRRTILFARTKLGADRIAEKIREAGVSALALHGGMTQRARTKTLADFKEGRVPVLVATDVAARGIHVDGIDLVLHVDPAGDPKDYLHRAGRTARAGESGTVVTLVLPKQRKATVRLLESAGVEAEQTRVTPSSEALRDLTGGRPVAEYVAEADAYHAARRAAREARMTDDRREGREGREGYRGNREGGYRGGERRSFGDRDTRDTRDRFDRGHRGGFGGGERSGSGSGFGGGERSGSGSGFGGNRGGFDRNGSGRGFERGGERAEGRSGGFDRDNRGGFDRNSSGRSFERGGERTEGRGFDRPAGDRTEGRGSGFGGERSTGTGSGFGGGERRSFGDRDSSKGGFGGRDSRGSEGRTGGFDRDNRGGERRSFGDRTSAPGRGFDRTEGRGSERSGSGFGGDRTGSQGRGFDRGGDRTGGRTGGFGGDRSGSGFNGGERRSFGDRNGSSRGRSFDRSGGERRSFGDRDSSKGGFGGRDSRGTEGRSFERGGSGRSFDRDNRGGGERRSFGDRPQGGFSRDSRGSEGRTGGFDRDNRGGERRSFGDRNGSSQGRGFDRSGGERRSFGDRDNRGGERRGFDRDNRAGSDRDRPAERRTFGERTAFGRPRGGYSNEQRDTRPPRDRRW